MMKKKRKSWLRAIMIVFVLLIIGLGISIYVSYNCLTVREYTYSAGKPLQDLKLIVLADLHDHEFGEKNEKLIEMVRQQEPDLILLDGDFLNEDSKDVDCQVELTHFYI